MRKRVDQEIKIELLPIGGDEALAQPVHVDVSVDSELTEGYGIGRTIQTLHGDLFAVETQDGKPILFSVDEDQRLIVIYDEAANTPAGRGQQQIGDELGAVQAFGVGQSANGHFVLAVAVTQATDKKETAVYITPPLSNDPAAISWNDLGWKRRGFRQTTIATRLLVGEEPVNPDDIHSGPMVVLFTQERGEALHYALDADIRKPEQNWQTLTLRENMDRVIDAVIGEGEAGPGIFVLGEQRGQLRLLFVPQESQAPHSLLPIPAGMSHEGGSLDIRYTQSGETELYLVGDGLFKLDPEHQHSQAGSDDFQTIALPEDIKGGHNLIVREDEQNVSVWALDVNNQTFEVIGNKHSVDSGMIEWGTPMKLAEPNMQRIAPIRNRQLLSNSLVLLSSDQKLFHWTLSPEDTSECFTKREIAVNNEKEMVRFDCYASTLTMVRSNGEPFKEKVLNLEATEWTEVIINGITQELQPGKYVKVISDKEGKVTLFNKVEGIACPIFYLSSAELSQKIKVDPAKKVRSELGDIKEANHLTSVQLENGEPLIDPEIQIKSVDAIAKCLARTEVCRQQIPEDGRPSSTYLQEINTVDLPAWSLNFDGESLHYQEGEEAIRGMQSDLQALSMNGDEELLSHSSNWLLEIPGRIFERFKQGLKEVFRFIVKPFEGAFEFILTIANRAYRFIIKSWVHIQEMQEVLLKAIGVGLKKFQRWLGFLFSWEDICVTHDVLLNVIKQVLLRGEDEIQKLENRVEDIFDDLIKRVEALGSTQLDHDIAKKSPQELAEEEPEEVSDSNEDMNAFSKSPQGNFVSYHLNHSTYPASNGNLTQSISGMILSSSSQSVVDDILKDLEELVGQLGEEVIQLAMTIGKLVGEGNSFNELIVKVGATTLASLLRSGKAILTKIVRLGRRLIQAMREVLFKELEIPFLSALYRNQVGSDLSAMGLLVLLISVPATSLYKLLEGEAPFPFIDEGNLTDVEKTNVMETLSAHERYIGLSRKPQTYGLEQATGIAFWSILSGSLGTVGTVALKKLVKLEAVKKFITKPHERLSPIPIFRYMWRANKWVATGIYLNVQAPDEFQGLTLLRKIRWGVQSLFVVDSFFSMFEPSGKLGAFFTCMGAIVDMAVIIPYTILRVGYSSQMKDDTWLVIIDGIDGANEFIGDIAWLCDVGYYWADEPTTKTVFFGLSYTIFALWLGNAAIINGVPFVTSRLHETWA